MCSVHFNAACFSPQWSGEMPDASFEPFGLRLSYTENQQKSLERHLKKKQSNFNPSFCYFMSVLFCHRMHCKWPPSIFRYPWFTYPCRQHQAALGPSAMDGGEERASKRLRQETNEQKPVDGVTDFKKGQRDFTPKSDTGTAICADFTSKEKEYTNGVIAPTLGRLAHRVPLPISFPSSTTQTKSTFSYMFIEKRYKDVYIWNWCMCYTCS